MSKMIAEENKPTPGPWHVFGPFTPPRGMIRIGDEVKHITVVRWGDPKDEADVCICVGPDQEANARMIVGLSDALATAEGKEVQRLV